MKRIFLLSTAALALAACGGNENNAGTTMGDSAAAVSPAPSTDMTGAGATTGTMPMTDSVMRDSLARDTMSRDTTGTRP